MAGRCQRSVLVGQGGGEDAETHLSLRQVGEPRHGLARLYKTHNAAQHPLGDIFVFPPSRRWKCVCMGVIRLDLVTFGGLRLTGRSPRVHSRLLINVPYAKSGIIPLSLTTLLAAFFLIGDMRSRARGRMGHERYTSARVARFSADVGCRQSAHHLAWPDHHSIESG